VEPLSLYGFYVTCVLSIKGTYFVWFQASVAMCLRSLFFWHFIQPIRLFRNVDTKLPNVLCLKSEKNKDAKGNYIVAPFLSAPNSEVPIEDMGYVVKKPHFDSCQCH
jgi:hypothetical protein